MRSSTRAKETMKPIVVGSCSALRLAAAGAGLFALACAHSAAPASTLPEPTTTTTVLPPPTGVVERTTFDASLGVHLDSMSRRASGLYVKDLRVGTGAVALHGKSVVV